MVYNLLLDAGWGRFWLIILGFIGVFFVMPHIMSAAFNKAEKEADKGNKSCLGAIFTIILIATIIVWVLQMKDCSNKSNSGSDDIEWQYKHTDRHY